MQDQVEKYDEYIKKIIRYHDLGKANHKFQNKLGLVEKKFVSELANVKEIAHEWLSLAFISREDKRFFHSLSHDNVLFSELARYCIAFHHTRTYPFNSDLFRKYVRYDLENIKQMLGILYKLTDDIDLEKDIRDKIDSQDSFGRYFPYLVFFKGILHKCDYAASAGIEPEQKYIGDYKADFKKWLPFELKAYQKEVANLSDRSIVLIASTGIGKTEYAMNWINGCKAFYLLGIRTAVNEMYKRFNRVFNNDNTILLHGETSYFLAGEEDEIESYNEKYSKARQLSYPLTIATADQLITSVFKYNGFELTYLTASYSKIVVDEIQSFSPEAIASIVVFLKEIHTLGGKFLLMTATLPPFIKEEFKKLEPKVNFPEPVLSEEKRHRIKIIDSGLSDSADFISKAVPENKKILIICNTVKNAQQMASLLEKFKPRLLHSRFINKDRKTKESEIMEATGTNNACGCLWISTQIVEASLDIDFDILFTECSTIDSLFQRFGRCFRRREYYNTEPNVYIFRYTSSSSKIYDSLLLERTWCVLQEYDAKLLSETDKQNMIIKVFANIESTRYFEQYNMYKKLLELGFRAQNRTQAQELFRKITNQYVVIPEPVFEDNKNVIISLINKMESDSDKLEKIRRKSELMDYTFSVQLYTNNMKYMPVESKWCQKNNIKLLKGVSYSYDIGLEFIENYKDYDNFID